MNHRFRESSHAKKLLPLGDFALQHYWLLSVTSMKTSTGYRLTKTYENTNTTTYDIAFKLRWNFMFVNKSVKERIIGG